MASFLALYLHAVLRVGRKDVGSPKERESEGEAAVSRSQPVDQEEARESPHWLQGQRKA